MTETEIALKLAQGETVERSTIHGKNKRLIMQNLIEIRHNCKTVIKQLKNSFPECN